MFKLKVILIILPILSLSFISLVYAQEYDNITYAIINSKDIESEILNIERFFREQRPTDYDKEKILQDLKANVRSILQDKTALNTYIQNNQNTLAENITIEIIKKSDEIHSYSCMFDLINLREEASFFGWRLFATGKDSFAIYDLLGNSKNMVPQTILSYEMSFDYDYLERCKMFKQNLNNEINDANKVLNTVDIGGFGWIFLVLTIGFFISIFLWEFKCKKFPLKNEHKYLILTILSLIIFSIWGYWYSGLINPKSTIFIALGGTILVGLYISIIRKIKPFLQEGYQKDKKTPISNLGLSEDYRELLMDNDIEYLEDLFESNIKDLSEGTGLTAETIINFRRRARKKMK